MINNELKDGEILHQSTEINNQTTDLKEVLPLEMSNITESANVMSLGLDISVMMKIVTDSMYKNKLIAFQEVTVNGRDAIAKRYMNGDTSFVPEIHITVDMEKKEASISDNGCGMSKTLVDEVYRIFGRSTKRNSSVEAGMFGIGAKSPFAISDEYTVSTISMETNRLLEFVVTKRSIIILKDEPSSESPGTKVSFPIPTVHSFNTIENMVKDIVKYWNCPVYISGKSEYGYTFTKLPLSLCNKDPQLSSTGLYPHFLTSDSKFSTFKNEHQNSTSKSTIYISHVPYTIDDEKINIPINIVVHDPNLITLTATRENIEKDSKYNDLISEISKITDDYIISEFDTFYKNIHQTMKLEKFPTHPTFLQQLFQKFVKDKKIKEEDYPYFNILLFRREFKSAEYYQRVLHQSIIELLSEGKKVLYTKKQRIPTVSSNHYVFSASSNCTVPFCLFCKSYNLSNDSCNERKSKYDYSFLPELIIEKESESEEQLSLPKEKKPKSKPTHFRGTYFNHSKSSLISFSEINNLKFTSSSTLFNDKNLSRSHSNNLVLVTSKTLKLLKSINATIVNSLEEYDKLILEDFYITSMDGISISILSINDYDLLIHNSYDHDTYLPILNIISPKKKILISITSIPSYILSMLKTKTKIYDEYEYKNKILPTLLKDKKIKISFEVSPSDVVSILSNLKGNPYILEKKITIK